LRSGEISYSESEKYLDRDFLFLSHLLSLEDDLAKQKTEGKINNQPGSIGRRSPITPIIKKIIPKER